MENEGDKDEFYDCAEAEGNKLNDPPTTLKESEERMDTNDEKSKDDKEKEVIDDDEVKSADETFQSLEVEEVMEINEEANDTSADATESAIKDTNVGDSDKETTQVPKDDDENKETEKDDNITPNDKPRDDARDATKDIYKMPRNPCPIFLKDMQLITGFDRNLTPLKIVGGTKTRKGRITFQVLFKGEPEPENIPAVVVEMKCRRLISEYFFPLKKRKRDDVREEVIASTSTGGSTNPEQSDKPSHPTEKQGSEDVDVTPAEAAEELESTETIPDSPECINISA